MSDEFEYEEDEVINFGELENESNNIVVEDYVDYEFDEDSFDD